MPARQAGAERSAGIAPARPKSQAASLHSICVEHGCRWLHYVCTDAALQELVASWHLLCETRLWIWCGADKLRDRDWMLQESTLRHKRGSFRRLHSSIVESRSTIEIYAGATRGLLDSRFGRVF